MCSADSPGRSIAKAEAVLIFDLDGTILSVNSFRYWAIYMLTGHFPGLGAGRRLALFLRTLRILMKRKLLGSSHSRTKYLLQELWAQSVGKDAGQKATQALNTILQGYARPNLQRLLAAVAQGEMDAVLATSAAGEYAQALGQVLGFSHILTTPLCTDPDRLENCGARKRDRVLAALDALGWDRRARIFFTDHEEDLPLIHACELTLWFGRPEDAEAIQARVPQARIIACRHMSEANILRLAGCQ